ncbi:hypothetical protein J8K89_02445 [Bacteroides fragilis]|uniref:hypothetical protein n=1 Tax=Bacteroides fragilis TaxID=817 RepID=UPI00202E774B|nr:hypothetical protein [Bacteroides fragilis]MCM0321907.1 hypothetical protein [Bacteroides fragilis]
MKKMNKIYGLNIDMLRLCYEIKEPNNINILRTREIGEEVDFLYFYLKRIEGKHFKFVYEIRYNDLGIDKLFGELKLGINDDKEDSNLHSNGYAKAWISVSNRVLYNDEIYYLDFIEDNLGLELHNITALDLCLDLSCDVARMIRKLIRNKNITTFLNTKEVQDRNEDRPEITYITSGNMNKDKYLTVSIKQKKAIKDKSRGATLTAYDKKAEIANSSGKKYIEEFYGNPDKLHRLEVHLNNDEVKEYLNRTKQELSFYSLVDNKFLLRLFDQTLNSLIRFEYNGKKLDWVDLLTGVITTTPGRDCISKLTCSKRIKKVA